jgi:ankyrin repeat protein
MKYYLLSFRVVVDLILSTGFDINARTARGTALHEAALCGKIEVVGSLLEAGINIGKYP